MYRAAAACGLAGFAALALALATRRTRYAAPWRVALLAPPCSALAKKVVRRLRPRAPWGLVIAGGATNWSGTACAARVSCWSGGAVFGTAWCVYARARRA